jgi:hypothetical protein
MNPLPHGCDYVPDLFNMKHYNSLLHIYYENVNTKDLRVCLHIIQKVLKDRGHLVKAEVVKMPKVSKIRGKGKNIINKYFDLDFKNIKNDPISWFEYIMINNDWDVLYKELDTKRDYYVYIHSDISMQSMYVKTSLGNYFFNGVPFYVGKGIGNRLNELSGRGKFHIEKYKKIMGLEEKDRQRAIYKIAENLTEREALILESKLITYFGCVNQINPKELHFTGRNGGLLINRDPTNVPKWVFEINKKITFIKT